MQDYILAKGKYTVEAEMETEVLKVVQNVRTQLLLLPSVDHNTDYYVT